MDLLSYEKFGAEVRMILVLLSLESMRDPR